MENCSSVAGVLLVFCVYLTHWTYCEVSTAAQLTVSCVTLRDADGLAVTAALLDEANRSRPRDTSLFFKCTSAQADTSQIMTIWTRKINLKDHTKQCHLA